MRDSTTIWRTTALLGLLAILAVTPSSRADNLSYISGGHTIYKWDATLNTVTPVTTSVNGAAIDSLIFDTRGDIIYSIIRRNQIGIFNTSTHSNRILASGSNLTGVADMALDPGGKSFLVSNAFDGSIDRINIATGTISTLYNGGLRPDGLAYDSKDNLFAVLALNKVAQLDPVTGAVLKTISTPNQPNGMTFDAGTGMLYVASDGGGFYTLPTDLSSARFTSVAGSPVFDGIASNGNQLYFTVPNTNAVIYNLNTGTVTNSSPAIGGADDIAPVSGLGSPIPEPVSMILFGTGLAALAAVAFRQKAASARLIAQRSFSA